MLIKLHLNYSLAHTRGKATFFYISVFSLLLIAVKKEHAQFKINSFTSSADAQVLLFS